jgi:hypothetical protein
MAYCGPRGIALSEFLRWDRSDQDAALEWQAREGRRCKQCGTDPLDWSEDRFAFHAHVGDQCPGCLARHRREQAEKKNDGGLQPGEHVELAHGPFGDCPRCNPKGPRPA